MHTIEVGALRFSEARLVEAELEFPGETPPPLLLSFPLVDCLCCKSLNKDQSILKTIKKHK